MPANFNKTCHIQSNWKAKFVPYQNFVHDSVKKWIILPNGIFLFHITCWPRSRKHLCLHEKMALLAYICKIKGPIIRFIKNLKMKNKTISLLLLTVLTLIFTSCFSSRKTGCPGNPQGNYKFKG